MITPTKIDTNPCYQELLRLQSTFHAHLPSTLHGKPYFIWSSLQFIDMNFSSLAVCDSEPRLPPICQSFLDIMRDYRDMALSDETHTNTKIGSHMHAVLEKMIDVCVDHAKTDLSAPPKTKRDLYVEKHCFVTAEMAQVQWNKLYSVNHVIAFHQPKITTKEHSLVLFCKSADASKTGHFVQLDNGMNLARYPKLAAFLAREEREEK